MVEIIERMVVVQRQNPRRVNGRDGGILERVFLVQLKGAWRGNCRDGGNLERVFVVQQKGPEGKLSGRWKSREGMFWSRLQIGKKLLKAKPGRPKRPNVRGQKLLRQVIFTG